LTFSWISGILYR